MIRPAVNATVSPAASPVASPPQRLEIADIAREHGPELLARHYTSADQRRVLRALVRCRTAALGGHIERCDHCPHQRVAYNSCRNRHCPKCQGTVAAKWMQDRAAELLDAPYFHLVFTLPASIAAVALQNPRLVYGMLFRAASQTLLKVAANPKHLGAKVGFLAVLHTWGQNLSHHPHVHCVVPGGGISPCGAKWISAKKDFFLPVRVLSRVFRGKFIALLKQAYKQEKLQLHGQLAYLTGNVAWRQWLNVAVRKEWVVYAKPPFGGPQAVLKYLARYTHRVAISNRRLLRLQDGQVTFGVKDYAAGGRRTTCSLSAVEFLRRFLQHVLPHSFMRIRHFGFMANRFRQQQLAHCRKLLGMQTPERPAAGAPPAGAPAPPTQELSAATCPACGCGRLHMTPIHRPDPPHTLPPPQPSRAPQLCDSS